jgi:hypothetical protein
MSSNNEPRITYGDYVEMISGDYKERRGFILDHHLGTDYLGRIDDAYQIVLDEKPPRYAPEYQLKPPVVGARNSELKVLRMEDEMVVLRVCDYSSTAVACHGIVALTNPPEIPFDADTAYGNFIVLQSQNFRAFIPSTLYSRAKRRNSYTEIYTTERTWCYLGSGIRECGAA